MSLGKALEVEESFQPTYMMILMMVMMSKSARSAPAG